MDSVGTGAPPGPRGIVDEPLFTFLLELEIQKCRRLRYCVSVVCMHAEVREAKLSLIPLAPRVIHRVRSTDVVVEVLPSTFALLLIHAETFSLPSIVHRLTEHLQGFVPDGATLSWSAGGACYPQTAAGAADLLRQAKELLGRAMDDGGHRLYLPAP